MTVKNHYDNLLANVYTWYSGDIESNIQKFEVFCVNNKLLPYSSKKVIDLGAGNGIQSIALAKLGFSGTAIDFNQHLLNELSVLRNQLQIDIVLENIQQVKKYAYVNPELIVCWGDTLPHMDSFEAIEQLINDCFQVLSSKGKFVCSFRDYSVALEDTNRFIPVKSDDYRIMTCMLEYFKDNIRVTDLLYEKENEHWHQKVSSYFKTRITREWMEEKLLNTGFEIRINQLENRMISMIAQKP